MTTRLARATALVDRLWFAAAAARTAWTPAHDTLRAPFAGYRVRLPDRSLDIACPVDGHGPAAVGRNGRWLALDADNAARLTPLLDALCGTLEGLELELDFADLPIEPVPSSIWDGWPSDDVTGREVAAAYAHHLYPMLGEIVGGLGLTPGMSALDLGAGEAPYRARLDAAAGGPLRVLHVDRRPPTSLAANDSWIALDLRDADPLAHVAAARGPFHLIVSVGGLNLSVLRRTEALAALAAVRPAIAPGGWVVALGYTPLAVRAGDAAALGLTPSATCLGGADRAFRQVLVAQAPTR